MSIEGPARTHPISHQNCASSNAVNALHPKSAVAGITFQKHQAPLGRVAGKVKRDEEATTLARTKLASSTTESRQEAQQYAQMCMGYELQHQLTSWLYTPSSTKHESFDTSNTQTLVRATSQHFILPLLSSDKHLTGKLLHEMQDSGYIITWNQIPQGSPGHT